MSRSRAISQIEGGMAYLPPEWADRSWAIGQIEERMACLPPEWADRSWAISPEPKSAGYT